MLHIFDEFYMFLVMKHFQVQTSNDPKVLVDAIIGELQEPLVDPFAQERVLVESRGMATWLQLQMTDQLSICANVDFASPGKLISDLLVGFLGGEAESLSAYSKENIVWRIYDLLPLLCKEYPGEFAEASRYLGKGESDRALRLSWELSILMEKYMTFRPGMMLQWLEGQVDEEEHSWQAYLWRAVRELIGPVLSFPELWRMCMESEFRDPAGSLPERLSVFGVSALPPAYLDILGLYAHYGAVNVYLQQPAPVFWGDNQLEDWQQRTLQQAEWFCGREVQPADLHIQTGNPLVASLGKTGREFYHLLCDREAEQVLLDYSMPAENSILACLQRSLFSVFNDSPEDPVPYEAKDESIVINNCHGPMREVEVLKDYLLRRLDEDSTLNPGEIIVMMPDPEKYVPYIRAVLGSENEGVPRLPYSLVDREPRQESLYLDAFLDLAEFMVSRASNQDVMELLGALPIRSKFTLEEEDLEAFAHWIRECHVHWGLDADHRESIGSNPSKEHSWEFALDRMSMGFCAQPSGQDVWEGILPFNEIEGENVIRFAKLSQILRLLKNFQVRSRKELSPNDWKDYFRDLVEAFLPNQDSYLLQRNNLLGKLQKLGHETAPTDKAVSVRAILWYLQKLLQDSSTSGQFLTRGITFCGLRPMRSVPARVVCLLGMNDGAFPRQKRERGFDASGPSIPGDRSPVDDDRYLFLETLWCAREYLYVSYTGQSIQKNQDLPPSVVVNELLDAIDDLVILPKGTQESLTGLLVKKQMLHPFSPKYFNGDLSRSYLHEYLQTAKLSQKPEKEYQQFNVGKLSVTEHELQEIGIKDLAAFFANPAKSFLRNRLQMSLWDEDSLPDESEPFEMDALTSYFVREDVIHQYLTDKGEFTIDKLAAYYRSLGVLPPGSLGQSYVQQAFHEVCTFVFKWSEQLDGTFQAPVHLELSIGEHRVHGDLDRFINGNQVFFRLASLKAKDLLRAWVYHLFVAASEESSTPTLVLSSKGFETFEPVEQDFAIEQLANLVELYKKGASEPISFLPEASGVFSKSLKAEQEEESAIRKAEFRWNGGFGVPPEKEDTAFQICFPHSPILHDQQAFIEYSNTVYGPMLDSLQS